MLRRSSRRGWAALAEPLSSWRHLGLAVGAILAVSMGAYFRTPLLPAIGRDLSMSPTALGFAITLFGLGRLVADIPAGRLSDRIAFRSMTAASGLMLAAGSVLLAAAPGPALAHTGFLVLGAASATMNTVGMTHFSSSVAASRRGASMGLFSAALLGGQALGPTAGGVIGEVGGWRIAILMAGLIGIVVSAIAVSRGGARPARETPSPPRTAGADAPTPSPVIRPLSRPERVALNAVPFAIFFMLGAVVQTLVPIIGSLELSLSSGMIGLALGVGGACRFVGALIGGMVSDRVSRKAALVPGLAVAGVGVALLGLDLSVSLWMAAIMLLSVSSFGVAVGATILADRSTPGEVGKAMGGYRLFGDFGMMIGPISATAIFDAFGRAAAAYGVAVILLATGFWTLLGLRDTSHRDVTAS